ncbi:hypothetical protein [Plantactinospora sp. GCM10030261]|uniref:hypothetical protein n=1 Tax=Plantactinospora sp. GCM10030261 TaxID=3273420 RepID=UPI0036243FD5
MSAPTRDRPSGESTTDRAPTRRVPPPATVAMLIAVAVVTLQALLVPLFSAPAANVAPRDLPVVVAGPPAAADGLRDRLAAAQPGAFEISTVPDAEAADRALRDREAYAAFVLGPDGLALHTASGASPTVAALLTQAAGQISAGGGQPVRVRDVVAGGPDDPRGGGFAAGFLPLVLTSMLAGVGLVLAVRSRAGRLLGLLGYGLLAGLAATAVLQGWLGVLDGDYPRNAAAVGLVALAAAATVTGLGALLGRPGVALAALLLFVVGNPLSAVAAAPELLPQPWGEIGQWLPAGAGGTLVRSAAFFDGAGAGPAVWILVGYATVGLVLTVVARPTRLGTATPNR